MRWALVLVLTLAAGCGSKAPAPVEAKSEATAPVARRDEVILDPVRQQKSGVEVREVSARPIRETINAPGQLAINEDRTWHVGALTAGRIVEVLASVGDTVQKGEVIARMHSHDVHEVRAAYRRAQEEVRRWDAVEQQALRVRDRARRLFDLKAASREQVESADTEYRNAQAGARNARTELEKERVHLSDFLEVPVEDAPGAHNPRSDYVPVKAPASGLVTERKATPGTVVSPGDTVYTITDAHSLWMIAAVNEADLGALRPGQRARVFVRAWPEQPFPATVLRLGEQLDPTTRTLKVRLSVPNSGGRLKPEMYANAEIERPQERQTIFIPVAAVQELNGQKVVFVQTGTGRFIVRPVDTGRSLSGEIEIVSGLAPGDSVVAKGAFVLKSQLLAKSLAEE